LKRRNVVAGALMFLLVALFAWSALATDAEIYFAADSNGQNRVANIQEGDSIWIVVYDPDENIDCDLIDKIWTDIKVMDPKTGAYIVWVSYLDENGDAGGFTYDDADYIPYKGHYPDTDSDGFYGADYLEETGADTGLFVSKRAFQVGTREDFDDPVTNTHVVDNALGYQGIDGLPFDFQWGHYEYIDPDFDLPGAVNLWADERGWFGPRQPVAIDWPFTVGLMDRTTLPAVLPSDETVTAGGYLLGRFENMDTLVGLYQDQNDAKDVALGLAKIIDTEATIAWDTEIYKDANGSAKITVTDPDENLNCDLVEYVPVFVLVNPGSWNTQTETLVANFCQLLHTGGVWPSEGGIILDRPIRWYNIYDSGLDEATEWAIVDNDQIPEDGTYFVQYPVDGVHTNVNYFDTTDENGFCRVMFYAQETGPNTGIFKATLNSLLDHLGFDSLRVGDVLVAYYLDPNDFDDLKIDPAYIETREHISLTSFTDANRMDKSIYWIGRDPVYVQVIDSNANVDPCCPEQVVVHICDPHDEDDSEWLILDETSSNSPVFFTNSGTELLPVWDALGVGIADGNGGYQLQLDNWQLEVFNEDSVYVRYNDVYYVNDIDGMQGLGDIDITTAFPPEIARIRVENDVSFDMVEIADTQVYDGSTPKMWFLDRQGNRVTGYVNSDCVFVEVLDPDQDEDQYRRERVDGYWDGEQNMPFGPTNVNDWVCDPADRTDEHHPINWLLGDTNIFQNGEWAKLYVLNPRNGHWAAIDLMETGVATGDFVSVICIDIVSVYQCVPTLEVLPGDTVIAAYMDPSNHSDSAWISIKVGVGGGGTPPGQASRTDFVDATGNVVASYTDADSVYVKVKDPSRAGATMLQDAVKIGALTFDLAPLAGATTDTFITAAITLAELAAEAGDSITATYTDPMDPADTSWDTISIVASELNVEKFTATPNPFSTQVAFGYEGSGIATTFDVAVYDLSGHVVWSETKANVTSVVWDGKNEAGASLANGGYIYVVMATDGTNTFTGKGTVFINR